jgi:hypothetical protein
MLFITPSEFTVNSKKEEVLVSSIGVTFVFHFEKIKKEMSELQNLKCLFFTSD